MSQIAFSDVAHSCVGAPHFYGSCTQLIGSLPLLVSPVEPPVEDCRFLARCFLPFTSADFSEGRIFMEEGFAERFGIKIGDTLEFDVQSVPISGKVVNFRKVNWNSFQPNFFISFQPGVLEEAPKVFIAALSNVSKTERLGLLWEVDGEGLLRLDSTR